MKKVIIADDNKEMVLMLASYLRNNNFDVVECFDSGKELLTYLKSNQVDLLLLDVFMPEVDGVKVLQEIKANSYLRPHKIIMLSAFNNESVIAKTSNLGADYFIVKPFQMPNLLDIINELLEIDVQNPEPAAHTPLDQEISNILIEVGIPAHVKGYSYLRDAIAKVYDDVTLLRGITKRLYPSIATDFDTIPTRVERAIRHAIEVAYVKGNQRAMSKIFAYRDNRRKPTNGEFIAIVADKLHLMNRTIKKRRPRKQK